MHRIIKGAIIAATSLVAIGAGSAAHASVTVNTDGTGFIGKGDVQTALDYNNAQMQANAGKLEFITSQDATQAVTQAVTQSGSQSATQSAVQSGVEMGKQTATQVMIETLSCIKTNGNVNQQVRYGTRDGERTAERIGTAVGLRTGTRTGTATGTRHGTQTGDLTGKISATVAYEARKSNQITGFNLMGFDGAPKFVADSAPAVYGSPTFGDYDFDAYQFGAYSFGEYEFAPYFWFGDFSFGTTTWDEKFTSDPNADPDLCVEGANNIVPGSVKQVITTGEVTVNPVHEVLGTIDAYITDGVITDGPISDGDIAYGDVDDSAKPTPVGTATVSVNGKALNTPVA